MSTDKTEQALPPLPQRWTSAVSRPAELGGFAAYGDYLDLRKQLEAALTAAPPAQPQEPVAWAIFDSQGFYEAAHDEDSARRFCDYYNKRIVDTLKPYRYAPLYASPPRAVEPTTLLVDGNTLYAPPPRAVEPQSGLMKLAKFGAAMLHAHRGNDASEIGDIDGFTAEEKALQCGVIEARTMTEPCGEACVCGCITDFPLECYITAEDVRQTIRQME